MSDRTYPCRLSCGADEDKRSTRYLCAECELKNFVGFKHTKCPKNQAAETPIYSAEEVGVQRENVAAFNRGDAPVRRGESYFMSRERDE